MRLIRLPSLKELSDEMGGHWQIIMIIGETQLARVVISSRVPSGRQKSYGPAPAEMMREPERENRSNLRPRAGEKFLGFARNDNAGQLRNS